VWGHGCVILYPMWRHSTYQRLLNQHNCLHTSRAAVLQLYGYYTSSAAPSI